jgi:hypothetical protein
MTGIAPAGDHAPVDGAAPRRLKLFINYRHSDTGWAAWALYFKLEARFGADNVFFDHGTLRAGEEWFHEIQSSLAGSGVLIALIGPTWLSDLQSRLRGGVRDYVVKEVDMAFRSRPPVSVIPLLVDDAALPKDDELPVALKGLRDLQVERLGQRGAGDDIERLVGRLVELRSEQA